MLLEKHADEIEEGEALYGNLGDGLYGNSDRSKERCFKVDSI